MNEKSRLPRWVIDGWRWVVAVAILLVVVAFVLQGVNGRAQSDRADRGQAALIERLDSVVVSAQRFRFELDCRSRVSKDVTIPEAKLLLELTDAVVRTNRNRSELKAAVDRIDAAGKILRKGLDSRGTAETDCAAEARRQIPGD